MADPKDKASAASEPKPAPKSAAVKPPVLEGTARPVEPPKPSTTAKPMPASKPESVSTEIPRPEVTTPPRTESKLPPPPKPTPSSDSGVGTAWLAGLVGGALGLGAAYGLAILGYWPSTAPAAPPEDPRIAQVSSSVPELQTITSTLQDELATLTTRVSGIESSGGATASADPAANDQTASDIAALNARLDELAAAPEDARDASATNAAALANLEAELAALRQSAAETQAELGTVTSQVATLQTDLSEGTAADQGQARLPLIVSGLETAFSTGASYDAEVAALRQALPDLAVPDPVLANAMTGLKRPDLIARDFNAVLPDILAGRPVSADAGWQEATSDWFRGIVALRPTEAVEGVGPEAVVARLEGAIARGDFIAAKTELDALPQPMRTAVGAVGGEIANQAAAQSFLTSLRQAALAGGGA